MSEILSLDNFVRAEFTINGLKYLVPSDAFLIGMLSKQPDFESQVFFCRLSNRAIRGTKPLLESEFLRSYELLCFLLGFNYQVLAKNLAVIGYHVELHGRNLISDKKRYDLAIENEKLLNDFFESNPLGKYQKLLERFPEDKIEVPEFLIANSYHAGFISTVMAAAKSDPLVKQIYIYASEQQLKSRRERYTYQKTETLAHTQCPYCGKFFIYSRGRGVTIPPPFCDSPECEREYNRLRKAKNRPLKTPKSWQAVSPKKRRCRGCLWQRQLDLNRLCKKCFSET